MTEVPSRVGIITGAAGRLGCAYVKGFADAGYRAVAADIWPPAGTQIEADPVAADVLPVEVDISDEDSVTAVTETAVCYHGRIDVLIKNVACFSNIEKRSLELITVDECERAFSVNVRRTSLCAHSVAPVMRELGSGRIINTSSMTWHDGGISRFAHASGKAAIVGLSRARANELGASNISVDPISPDDTSYEAELFRRQPETADRSRPSDRSHACRRLRIGSRSHCSSRATAQTSYAGRTYGSTTADSSTETQMRVRQRSRSSQTCKVTSRC